MAVASAKHTPHPPTSDRAYVPALGRRWLTSLYDPVVRIDPDMLQRARSKVAEAGVAVRFDSGRSSLLAYPDACFDRVVSSLLFHHLTAEEKVRTLGEVARVLAPGGQLHIADWGAPAKPLMRALFLSIRLLDGFDTTKDNIEGRLPHLMQEAGFADVALCRQLPTVYGTLALYSARNPGG